MIHIVVIMYKVTFIQTHTYTGVQNRRIRRCRVNLTLFALISPYIYQIRSRVRKGSEKRRTGKKTKNRFFVRFHSVIVYICTQIPIIKYLMGYNMYTTTHHNCISHIRESHLFSLLHRMRVIYKGMYYMQYILSVNVHVQCVYIWRIGGPFSICGFIRCMVVQREKLVYFCVFLFCSSLQLVRAS